MTTKSTVETSALPKEKSPVWEAIKGGGLAGIYVFTFSNVWDMIFDYRRAKRGGMPFAQQADSGDLKVHNWIERVAVAGVALWVGSRGYKRIKEQNIEIREMREYFKSRDRSNPNTSPSSPEITNTHWREKTSTPIPSTAQQTLG